MTSALSPSAVWVVRIPPPGSADSAVVSARAWTVDPWAAVGPASLLDEDPARLVVLAAPDGAPAAVGVLAVHPVGPDDAALLELADSVDAPTLDGSELEALAADRDTPAALRAYARLASGLDFEIRRGNVLPGPMPRANILCLLFPHLKICRSQKRR